MERRLQRGRSSVGKSLNNLKTMCGEKEVGSTTDSQEKPLLFAGYPYNKPTQMDEENLRPTGEALKTRLGKMTP